MSNAHGPHDRRLVLLAALGPAIAFERGSERTDWAGDHLRRHPLAHLADLGFVEEFSGRSRAGAVEGVIARRDVGGGLRDG